MCAALSRAALRIWGKANDLDEFAMPLTGREVAAQSHAHENLWASYVKKSFFFLLNLKILTTTIIIIIIGCFGFETCRYSCSW